MKITTPHYINQTYTNPANTAANQNLKAQKTADETTNDKLDSINISELTKDLQKISKAMETDPVDRQKYVADIKQKVESNQYNILLNDVQGRISSCHPMLIIYEPIQLLLFNKMLEWGTNKNASFSKQEIEAFFLQP